MATSISSELGRAIAAIAREQDTVKDNISGNDAAGALGIFNSELVKVAGVITGNNRTVVGVLIVGNPVYGEVFNYPVFMPIVLGHPVWGLLGTGYLDGDVTYSYTELFSKKI